MRVAVEEGQQCQIGVNFAVFEVDGVVFVRIVVEVNGVKFLCPVVVLCGVNLKVDRMTHHSNLSHVTLRPQITLTAYETREV